MFVEWTQHLKDPEEKQRFLNEIRNAKPVLDFLKTRLDAKERTLNRSEINISNYNIASWDNFQAHKNGYRQCLYEIGKLIDLDQQKDEENDR